jgi:hypothetical protein
MNISNSLGMRVGFVPEEQRRNKSGLANCRERILSRIATKTGWNKSHFFKFNEERMRGGEEHLKVFFLPCAIGKPVGTN